MHKRRFSFEANALLLGQFRRMVRSRLVFVLLNVYLAAMVAMVFAFLLDDGNLFDWLGLAISRSSLLVVLIFLLCYLFTSVTLLLFGAVRTVGERIGENPMLVTALRPGQIVHGKILFGIVFCLLFLSLTLPFLTVAYLMRGVDVRLIPFGAATCFGLTMLHYVPVLPFFSGVTSRGQAIVFALPFLLIEGLLFWFGCGSFLYGIPDLSLRMNFGLFVLGYGFLFFVLLFPMVLVALANYAPPTSNRMFPLRVGVAGLGVLLLALYFATQLLDARSLLPAGYEIADYFRSFRFVFWWTIPFLFLIGICEDDKLSPRIRRTIPRSFEGRLLVFPFYSGAAGALVWALWVVFGELVASGIGFLFKENVGFLFPSGNIGERVAQFLCGFSATLLFWDYCTLTLLLHLRFFRRRFSRRWNWLPIFGIVGVILLLEIVTMLLENLLSISFKPLEHFKLWILLPFPFWQSEFWPVLYQLLGASVFAVILMFLARRWFRLQFRKFTKIVDK